MNGFWQSTSGRLITFSVGLALAGSGAAAIVGGTLGIALLGAGFLGGIACSIVGVALSLEDYPYHATGLLIGLPFALFLFAFGNLNMVQGNPSMAYLLIALGLGAVARSIFVGSSEEPVRKQMTAGAH